LIQSVKTDRLQATYGDTEMSINFDTSFADAGKVLASFAAINGICGSNPPLGGYKFTVSSASATAGATYTNNGVTFTVLQTISSLTVLVMSGNGAPSASGTLTKASGSGDSTITYSAVAQYSNWGTLGPVIKEQATMISDILARLEGAGLTSLIPFASWQQTLAGMDSQLSSQKQVLQSLLQQIIILRVNNDVRQQDTTSFSQAFAEWVRQMQVQSKTVKSCTVSAATTPGGSNVGTATVYCSLLDVNGLTLEYSFAETMVLKCTEDQFTGATAGSETLSIVSPAEVTDTLSYLWPGGSGINTTTTVNDPTQGNGSGGNMLTGSATGATTVGAFKAWTMAVPNGWTIQTDAGNISDGTTAAYSGTDHCLQLTGNTAGSNANTALYQTFANGGITGGSTVTLLPNTVYQFYAQVKADVVPAAGVVQFNLVDAANATITNNAGTNQRITSTISGFGGTTYQTVTGTFQTPTNMPTNVRLQIIASTPITTGSNVFIDFACLAVPTSQGNGYGGLYPGGPYMSVFRGDVDLVNYVSNTVGDRFQVAVANNYGTSSPTVLSFGPMFNQLCNLAGLGYIMPTSGSPNEADSLIS